MVATGHRLHAPSDPPQKKLQGKVNWLVQLESCRCNFCLDFGQTYQMNKELKFPCPPWLPEGHGVLMIKAENVCMCSRAPTHMIQHFSTNINYYICQMHHHPLSCLFWLINCIWPFKISILRDAIVFSNTTCLINWSTDGSKLNSDSQSDEHWEASALIYY